MSAIVREWQMFSIPSRIRKMNTSGDLDTQIILCVGSVGWRPIWLILVRRQSRLKTSASLQTVEPSANQQFGNHIISPTIKHETAEKAFRKCISSSVTLTDHLNNFTLQ